MNSFVPITLFGWVPFVLVIFASIPARRAILVSYMGAWLFLPNAGYMFSGIPDYDKVTAANASVMLAALIFDLRRLSTFRLCLLDLPVIIWCLCPLFSSVTNGLGVYDGVSTAVGQTVMWGVPYMIGRLYFTERVGMYELAIAIFVGGVVYMPLCVWEIKMSPQLHNMVYGFSTQRFLYNVRMGGYRPTVFMQTGLMVAMWMVSATSVGIWLWGTGALRKVLGVPVGWLVLALFATTVACRSLYAICLALTGIGIFCSVKWFRSSLPIVCIVLLIPLYMVVRAGGQMSRDEVMAVARDLFPAERLHSLEARLIQEDLFSKKAMQRPLFGWSGWRRSWPVNQETGEPATRGVDGFWTIYLGNNGIIGLGSITVAVLLPPVLLLRRLPVRHWCEPGAAPLAATSVILVLFMLDNLLNAMYNPVFMLIAGGLSGWLMRHKSTLGAAGSGASTAPHAGMTIAHAGVCHQRQ